MLLSRLKTIGDKKTAKIMRLTVYRNSSDGVLIKKKNNSENGATLRSLFFAGT